jgi:hypothetical protein
MTKRTKKTLWAIFLLVTGIIFWFLGLISARLYNWEKSSDMITIGIAFFTVGGIYSLYLLSSE